MNSLTATGKLIHTTLLANRQGGYLFTVAIILAGVVWFRYFGNFYSTGLPSYVIYFTLAFLPFCISYLLQAVFFRKQIFLSKPWFWILLFIAPLVFTIRAHCHLPSALAKNISDESGDRFLIASAEYCWRVIMVVLPVYLLWWMRHRKQIQFYGWKFNFQKRLFLCLSVGMLPLIFFAATQQSFTAFYPKAITSAGLGSDSPLWQWMVFEISYGLDFFSVELFFRGFLIMAFVRYAGAMAIVPAACFYCCIHFDKPMAEAISSFFGGLLLGSISYHTRSIWTGYFLHLCMAWLMELTSYWLSSP